MKAPRHIVLSRADGIGDVVLSLPLAGLLTARYPGVRITWIGKAYTAPVLACCSHVDRVLTLEELQASQDPAGLLRSLGADAIVHVFPRRDVAAWACKAGIPLRIGTGHRWWHWTTCNVRPMFSRRKSELHEAQLNQKLLAPFGLDTPLSLPELAAQTAYLPTAPDTQVKALIPEDRRVVLLHPGSRGSAVEWGIERFVALARLLDPQRYRVYFTGSEAEGTQFRSALPMDLAHVQDLSGKLDLQQLIALIGKAHALVAASTGPLHLAAASGIRAIGLYAPRRPIHPGRWAPIGPQAHALVHDPACAVCAAGQPCACVTRIAPERVLDLILP